MLPEDFHKHLAAKFVFVYASLSEMLEHLRLLREASDAISKDLRYIAGRKRLWFQPSVERAIIRFKHETNRRFCDCCCKATVIDTEGNQLSGSHFDHFYGPSSNAITNCWLTCAECNMLLRVDAFRRSKEIRFKGFQFDLSEWLETQVELARRGDGLPLLAVPIRKPPN